MEKELNDGFCQMTESEMLAVGGGLSTFAGIGLGLLAGWAVDGVLLEIAGKTGSEIVHDLLFGSSDSRTNSGAGSGGSSGRR